MVDRARTQRTLEHVLVIVVANLERDDPSAAVGSLVAMDGITMEGTPIVEEAFPAITLAAPGAFYAGVGALPVDLAFLPTTALAQAAAVGATTITVQGQSGFKPGDRIMIGMEAARITAIAGSSVGPFTWTLAAPLWNSHAAGTRVLRVGAAAGDVALEAQSSSFYRDLAIVSEEYLGLRIETVGGILMVALAIVIAGGVTLATGNAAFGLLVGAGAFIEVGRRLGFVDTALAFILLLLLLIPAGWWIFSRIPAR